MKPMGEITVEVDRRTEGAVVNVIRPLSPTTIALDEFKRRFDATFINRFDPIDDGTRYTVDADVRFRMPLAILGPLVRPIVKRRLRRYVLDPMRAAAERAGYSP